MLLSIKRWLPLLSQFLGGQALVQVINLCTALLLLRLLPIDEYALFVIASFYLSIGSVGSDLNLSTALSTFGARISNDRVKLSGLFALIATLRRKLFIVMVLIIVALTPYMVKSHAWQMEQIFILLIPIIISIWFQQKLTLRTMVLNIQHDSTGLFQTGLTGALVRMLLTYTLCTIWPFAIVAVLGALVSFFCAGWLAKRRCVPYLNENTPANHSYDGQVKNFIYPLLPAAVYFTFQGQISIFLISIFGSSNAIAEVGALTRFAQIFAFLGVLNGFFFQPVFSRINDKKEFIRKLLLVTGLLTLGLGLILFSAWLVPDWWLLLLGSNYAGLQSEVLLAVAGPVASYFYGFFFTLLAARAFTQGQYWYVLVTLIVQVIFIALIGVDTTHKALELNLMNSLATMFVEIALLFVLIRKWQ